MAAGKSKGNRNKLEEEAQKLWKQFQDLSLKAQHGGVGQSLLTKIDDIKKLIAKGETELPKAADGKETYAEYA